MKIQAWLAAAWLALLPLAAHSVGNQELCAENGGNFECIKSDMWVTPQVGPYMGRRFDDTAQACLAANNYSAGVVNPTYWAYHPQWGTGCSYDAQLPLVTTWAFYQNWVLPTSRCIATPAGAREYTGFTDPTDTALDFRGHGGCVYAVPLEERTCPDGNPVLPGTGRKIHSETDYEGAGAAALNVRRYYRSAWADGIHTGMAPSGDWGGGWKLSVHAQLAVDLPMRLGGTTRALRADGNTETFYAARSSVRPRTWSSADSRNQLEELATGNTTTGWQLKVFEDDSLETYDRAGKLLSIRARNGWTTVLAYNATAQLTTLKNPFGRQITFGYDASGRISSMTAPGGELTRYGYDAANNLVTVTWPDGNLRRYHYEDPRFAHALTGVTDELGVRIGTYSYQSDGRVAETVNADGSQRMAYSYSPYATGSSFARTTVKSIVNGTTTTRDYAFDNPGGSLRPMTASAPCTGCGNTAQATQYNTDGDKIRELTHDGSVTFFAYDGKGRETERASFPAGFNTATSRPALANATRVVSTQWHANWHLPLQVAEPNKLSAYTYDDKGNLTGQSDLPTSDATGAQAFSATPAGPPGVIAPGTVVDVVFVNDGVTVVNGVRTEDRNLIVENISVGGATPMLPTDPGVIVDQGDGTAAFDGVSTLPGQTGLWWNAALRFTVPAANIGSAPTLKVRARATLAGGIGAKMVVRVGGAILGTVDVTNVGTAADYSFALPGATPPPAVPAGTGVDVVFTNDGVTVVNGVRTEDRNLIIESLSVGGGTPMLPTASGVTVDQGSGSAAFDGIDTLPGQSGLWWDAALRFAVPATNIGSGNTLVVRAKATLAGGIGANMVVRVGGVVIGSATVNNTSAYADYSFAIPGAGRGGGSATATGWSYDANSLPVAIVQKSGGLETGKWTLGYSTAGDVTSIVDVTGGSSAALSNDARACQEFCVRGI